MSEKVYEEQGVFESQEVETEEPLKLPEMVDDESTSRRQMQETRDAREAEAEMERKQGYERAREKEEQKNRILRGEEKGDMIRGDNGSQPVLWKKHYRKILRR